MGRRRKTQGQTPKTTADHLAQAVSDDLLPEDRQTLEDYGFDRAVTVKEKCFLLGLYQGLINFQGISPKTIHDWRVRGVLVDEIKAVYSKIPDHFIGFYFRWFLQNQHIIALAGQPLSDKEIHDHGDVILLRAWRFTGGSENDSPEQARAAIERKPAEEQMCHTLYTLLLSSWSPSPDLDLWIDFGFASCTSEGEERVLCGHYQRLINLCTFKEFCDAYRNRRLLALFLSKGVQVDENPRLRDLLASDLPSGWKKSVWDLKSFIAQDASVDEESGPILPVVADYGFVNCKNASERQQLKKVYKAFFINRSGDPLALHEACIKGNIYSFLSTIVGDLHSPKHSQLMKNHYPIPDSKIAGLSWAGDVHVHVGDAPPSSGASLGDGQYGPFYMSFRPHDSAVSSGPSSGNDQDRKAQMHETGPPNPHADLKISSKFSSDGAQKYGTSHWHAPCSLYLNVPSGSSSGDSQEGKAQTHETSRTSIPNANPNVSSDDQGGMCGTSHTPNPHPHSNATNKPLLDDNQGGIAQTYGTSCHAPSPHEDPSISSRSSSGDDQGRMAQTHGTRVVQAYPRAPAWQASPLVYFVCGAVLSAAFLMRTRRF